MLESDSASLNGRRGAACRLLFLVAFVVLGGLSPGRLDAADYLTGEEAMRLAFGSDATFEKKNIVVLDEDRSSLSKELGKRRVGRFFEYYEIQEEGRPIGYAVVDDVKGKHQMIDYMIAFNGDHSVKAVEVLAYRESYGDEIRQNGFRKQFVGRKPGEPLRLNREIVNISGATISCRSMIEAVREKLAFVHALLPVCGESAKRAGPPREESDEVTEPRRRSRMLMGTLLEIEVRGLNRAGADVAIGAAFDEVARIESAISSWRPDSEISRINAAGGGSVVEIDPEVHALLERCREYHVDTNGRFDVTVGPMVLEWRNAGRSGRLPGPSSLAGARSRSGMNHLELSGDTRVRPLVEGLSLDLGGVGKGYAMDRAAEVLRHHGANVALIDFGGQLLALDAPDALEGWPAMIADADAGWRVVFLENESLATSGDSERFVEIEGVRYSHIVDPVGGMPATGRIASSAIAPTSELADVWSTALFLLGEEGLARIESDEIEALIVDATGEVVANSGRFERLDVMSRAGRR